MEIERFDSEYHACCRAETMHREYELISVLVVIALDEDGNKCGYDVIPDAENDNLWRIKLFSPVEHNRIIKYIPSR